MTRLPPQNRSVVLPGRLGWLLVPVALFGLLGLRQDPPAPPSRPADFRLFDNTVAVLPNGNIVVADPYYDHDTTHAVGAIYLFDGRTRSLISRLTGRTTNDQVGSGGITVLANGNFVVCSPNWSNGPATRAGAVTWGSGTAGVSGVVSATNSLVGTHPDDQVGNHTPMQPYGKFAGEVVNDPEVTALPNGHYVVSSPYWRNDTAARAGAVTWGNGQTGTIGVVSTANSLVGAHTDDQVGSNATDDEQNSEYIENNSVLVLPGGNYLVSSPRWQNTNAPGAGAVTWGSGTTGVRGLVSTANSLVGTHHNDRVGGFASITVLPTGNYVVCSPGWKNRAAADGVGAVTWGSGQTGVKGAVHAANSLVGAHSSDYVGSGGVTVLPGGNFVVRSPCWQNQSAPYAGAVTWGSGTAGLRGVVSAANSLVGTHREDQVGAIVTVLTNGNYVVGSPNWRNQAAAQAGAATWGNGRVGAKGAVSPLNSLVGTHRADRVGSGVTALTNGHYVVGSPCWQHRAVPRAGAVTWSNGRTGTRGAVSAANSLVGSQPDDQVGNDAGIDAYVNDWDSNQFSNGVTALPNGHYVVVSPYWKNGAAHMAGAVTWGRGTAGVTGAVSEANSLVGSSAGDLVGSRGVTALANGNYVVASPQWRHGTAAGAGAVTWGSGTAGVRGKVDAANSLVGTRDGDLVGAGDVTALPGGNYVVRSQHWQRRAATPVGAVTWGSGTEGVRGAVSAANSLVGAHPRDYVSLNDITVLANGSYVVHSLYWQKGSNVRVGAVTWGSGTEGVRGVVSAANSLVAATDEQAGLGDIIGLANGNFVVSSPYWRAGSGAVTWGSGTAGVQGVVSASNSLVSDGHSGWLQVAALSNGDYLVRTYVGQNDTVLGKLALAPGNGTTGTTGHVGPANSLVYPADVGPTRQPSAGR